jgi:hypothetical protein
MLGTETVRAPWAKGFKNKIYRLSANDIEQSFMTTGADYFVLEPFPGDRKTLEGVLDGIVC